MSALADRVAALTDQAEARLANERADRQLIAEDLIAGLRRLATAGSGIGSAELEACRTAAAAVLADYRAALASAPLAMPPGREWMLRLASVLDNLLTALAREAAALPGHCALNEDEAATVLCALDDAAEHIRERAANCPDCEASPAELCDGCSDRLSRAEAYEALAATMQKAGQR